MSKRAISLVLATALAGSVLGFGLGFPTAAGAATAATAVTGTTGRVLRDCNPPPPPPLPPAEDFVDRIDNVYFPLVPGTTYLYMGQEEGKRVKDTVLVTDRHKTILGIRTTVLLDLVEQSGRPHEKTFDWYAQDRDGNVWYLGEDAFDYKHGHWVKAPDSWEAGVDGAEAGIIMEAHPQAGDAYTQEHYPGHAEDMAWVLSTDAVVSVPYGTFRHALKSNECTPLEPGVIDRKYFARGIGEVAESMVRGGSANLELVWIKHDG